MKQSAKYTDAENKYMSNYWSVNGSLAVEVSGSVLGETGQLHTHISNMLHIIKECGFSAVNLQTVGTPCGSPGHIISYSMSH